MPKLNFAEMGLIHIGGGGDYSQRHGLFITHLSQPFTESLNGRSVASLFLSSHFLARYIQAGFNATKKFHFLSDGSQAGRTLPDICSPSG
jgi:hypothetical protein